ncbi:hypothetical protein UA38_20445 [Photobacterium kishitanii]|uniref:Fimbrial-type adhesion domain-containing protein n=1 Tax=Photobacterium kishitanii TaxID=318456 RepID=A0AAX0YXY9_9GAMM|nr:fimbrial protein [Photobacterium kishitanii]KJG55305.1 hypothetical protein UA38_20445 [Photobacterium kishitanii]KJG58419.1 hypothetical protein UA42_19850 [Photobacterium kishitanii]KJG63861.1 hypothetical protein UA40_19855 [Photobacterium kishitanii]KJG67350.1 hypothetical protein UA41_19430 [Photobacterium kishitanii]PSX19245.1 hypothetical protein C0W70_12320 [Photobacterium kishitanii]
MFILRTLPFILLISFPVLAKEATAIVTVEGIVVIPTCSINGKTSDGLSQTVDMGLYTANAVIAGNTKNINVPIIVHCSNPTILKGISLSLSTLGAYGPVGSSQPGAIKTNLKGVSIGMKWKSDDTPVSLDAGVKKQFPNNDSNNYDASMISKVLPMPGFSLTTMEKGYFKSGVNAILSYY